MGSWKWSTTRISLGGIIKLFTRNTIYQGDPLKGAILPAVIDHIAVALDDVVIVSSFIEMAIRMRRGADGVDKLLVPAPIFFMDMY